VLQQKSVSPAVRDVRWPALRRQRRAVLVQVFLNGRVVDSFEATQPQTLRAALRPVYAHLPAGKGSVRFRAVDESWLPFGLRRARNEVELGGLPDALAYIAA
jgi:hypothetical protein